jgi:class 3 adenylate cyclase/pSer/pThr/pTyr-binding forkhead associated (FHA) protein
MGYEAAYVVITGPGHQGTRLPLREGITSFGRLPSNDVLLLGDLVSRHHARIIFFDGRASLQDLGSHNGSFVNEEQVTTRALNDGDALRIGNFRLDFCVGEIPADEVEATRDQSALDSEPSTLAPPPPRDAASTDARPTRAPPLRFDSETGSESSVPDHLRSPIRPENLPSMPNIPAPVPRERGMFDPDTDVLPGHLSSRASGQSPMVDELEQIRSGQTSFEETAGTLVLLYRVTDALARATNAGDFLDQVLSYTVERIGCEAAVFFRATPGAKKPTRIAWRTAPGQNEPEVSMTVLRWAMSKCFTVYSHNISEDLRFKDGQSVLDLSEDAKSIVCVPISSREGALGALYLSRRLGLPFSELEVDALEAICHLAAAGIDRIELRQRALDEGLAREALSRFHSPDVVERILREPGEGGSPKRFLEGRNATVCFFDIPGFTALSERLSPEEISDFLGRYFEDMSAIIFAHRGTIHKLLGDGIVSVFGAPFSYGNDAARAVAASLDMRGAFDRLVSARPSLGQRRLRSGINTGWLLSGAIGSRARMDFALIGETVNTAARIQASAAPGAILISETTQALVGEAFVTRKLGLQQVRGRTEPLHIFEVIGRGGNDSEDSS